MGEFKKTQDKAGFVKPVERYREEGRHGDSYIAQRLPVGERRDFLPRVKRKYPEQS